MGDAMGGLGYTKGHMQKEGGRVSGEGDVCNKMNENTGSWFEQQFLFIYPKEISLFTIFVRKS